MLPQFRNVASRRSNEHIVASQAISSEIHVGAGPLHGLPEGLVAVYDRAVQMGTDQQCGPEYHSLLFVRFPFACYWCFGLLSRPLALVVLFAI
jgi:hypothetical protein